MNGKPVIFRDAKTLLTIDDNHGFGTRGCATAIQTTSGMPALQLLLLLCRASDAGGA